MIALALDGPPGDGSFVDSAVEAARGFTAAGATITALVEPDIDDIDPAWTAVLAHGSALTDWAHIVATTGTRTVLTDLPQSPLDLETIHYVDWAWDAGLANIARRILVQGGHIAALLTGPDFPPQQRIEASVLRVMASEDAPMPSLLRARSFADLDEVSELVAAVLGATKPGDHVISSAGPLGEHVSAQLRTKGRITHGITRRDVGHRWRVVSDVRGAVEQLLAGLVTEDPLPRVTRCDIASGLQSIAGDEAQG